MKNLTFIICLVVSFFSFGQDAHLKTDKERENTYQQQLNTQFKKENAWYRIWNRYEINPGFSKYALGYSYINPNSNWKNAENTFAFRYRRNHLDISGSFWKGTPKGLNDSIINNGSRFTVGYTTPSKLFRIGKRNLDVKGFLIQPAFSIGYVNDAGNHGAYFAPSIHLQLPFAIIEARTSLDFTSGGFNVYPELSLQMDALRTLFDPNLTRVGTDNHSYSTASPMGGGWYSVTTYSSSTPVMVKDIGPFWAITPRYGTIALGDNLLENYHSYGVGISGRINFLTGDIYVKKNRMRTGTTNNSNVDAFVNQNFDNTKVTGLLNTTEVTFEGGFNIIGVVMGIIKPASYSGMDAKTTPLNRLNFHIGLTYIMPENATYENSDSATVYTANFFKQNPDIENNATNNPLIHTKEWGVTFGTSLEMGAIGLRSSSTFSKSNGASAVIEVYYMLPVSRIRKVYKKG